MYGIFRLIQLTYDRSGDIGLEKLMVKDYMFWGNIIAWALLTLALTAFF